MSAPRDPISRALQELGAGVWMLSRGLSGAVVDLRRAPPYADRRIARAIEDHLWRPLPTVLALAGLTGVIAGLLCAEALKRFDVEAVIVPSVVRALAAQVAPLLVGVFAAGRVSVALAARLGGMQLEGEADALVLRGLEPARFVLGPVVAALLLAAPVLTAAAAAAAALGVGAMLQVHAVTPWARYVRLIVSASDAQGLLQGVLRGWLFVLLAAAVGGAAGSAPVRDLGDLERRTGLAFTTGLLVVFSAAALTAALG